MWVNDPRNGSGANTIQIEAGPILEYQVGGTTGNAGQFVTGTFTADATTQVVTLDSGTDGWQVNALQVRSVPEPSSSVMLLGGLGLLTMLRRRS